MDGDTIRGEFGLGVAVNGSPTKVTSFKTDVPQGSQPFDVLKFVLAEGSVKSYAPSLKVENNSNLVMNILVPLIPWLLIFAIIYFFIFRQLRNSAGQAACSATSVAAAIRSRPKNTPTSPSTTWPASKRPKTR